MDESQQKWHHWVKAFGQMHLSFSSPKEPWILVLLFILVWENSQLNSIISGWNPPCLYLEFSGVNLYLWQHPRWPGRSSEMAHASRSSVFADVELSGLNSNMRPSAFSVEPPPTAWSFINVLCQSHLVVFFFQVRCEAGPRSGHSCGRSVSHTLTLDETIR